ncbi:unnamed protein product, partial [Cylicostephanus goldi]
MSSKLTPLVVRSFSRSAQLGSIPLAPVEKPSAIRTHQIPGERIPLAKYGGRHTVVALPGDGIGPEMIEHIKKIFHFSHAPINFETVQVSSELVHGDLEAAIKAIERNGVAIKNIDIVLIRENTEGEYSGLEHETLPGIVESIK